ncbi:hypothetical protein LINPERPRIM_LOCUS37573, partial [Linum perenne]
MKKAFCIHSFKEIESCDCAVRCVRRSPAFVAPLRFCTSRYYYLWYVLRVHSWH